MASKSTAKAPLFVREATGLVRALGPLDSFVFAVQGISLVTSFWFFSDIPYILPYDNPLLLLAIGAVLSTIQAASWALLMVVMPRSGGDYVYNTRLIHPAVGVATDFMQVAKQPGLAPVFVLLCLGLISDMFVLDGIATTNPSLIAIGQTLGTPNVLFVTSSIFCLIALFALVGRLQIYARIQTIIIMAGFATVLLLVGLLAATPTSTYQMEFNSFFKTDYTSIVQMAAAQNMPSHMPSLSWTGVSLFGLSQLFFYLYGAQWATYVGGEIRRPEKTAVRSIVGAQVAVSAIVMLTGWVCYNTFGFDFSYAANYLGQIGKSPWPLADDATFLNLAAPVLGNPLLISIVFLILAAGGFAFAIFALLAATRKLFAWSFDRLIPAKFSDVNQRFATPVFTAIVVWVLSEIFTVVYVYGSGIWAVVHGFTVVNVGIFLTAAAVAGVLLPFRRQIWEHAPPLARKKIGPIPVVGLLSFITLVTVMVFLVGGDLYPAFVQGTIKPAPMSWTIGIFLFGGVYYYIVKWYRRRHDGLDLSMVFKEIPPE